MSEKNRPPVFQYPTHALPRVLGAGVFHNPVGTVWPERKLEVLSVNFAACGLARCMVNGQPMKMQAGHVYLWKPGDTLAGDIEEQLTSMYVRFEWPGWTPENARDGLALPKDIALSPDAHRDVKDAYDLLIECVMGRSPGWELGASGFLQVLMAHLLRATGGASAGVSSNVAIDRRLGVALGYMESNLAKRLSVGEVAEHARLSEDYFRRLFTRRMGISPVQFINRLRVREGRRLISEDPGMTVGEAGLRSGFTDVRHFARVFRQHYKITPDQYRRSLDHSVAASHVGA